jgi:hypothetical protein
MEQTSKELLIKDLCYRLHYGVKVEAHGLLKTISDDYDNRGIINAHVLNGLNLKDFFKTYSIDYIEKVPLFNRNGECNIKPYLFPLSSINEEQANELFNLFGISLLDSVGGDYIKINECTGITFFLNKGFDVEMHLDKLMNWLNTNHFDYRGLIPMGLAIDATGLNIY